MRLTSTAKLGDAIVATHKQAILDASDRAKFEREVTKMLADLDGRMGLLDRDSKALIPM
jgi:AAA+ superfamily predicted ATPase